MDLICSTAFSSLSGSQQAIFDEQSLKLFHNLGFAH
jgi:hypothetical protein